MTPKERAAMQQALEALEFAGGYCNGHGRSFRQSAASVEAITALQAALAEPDIEEMTLTQIAARHEQAKQEQVAVLDITYGREPECYATPNADDLPEGTYRLYAAPVRTKDLTASEIRDIWNSSDNYDVFCVEFARAVIAADREKNK